APVNIVSGNMINLILLAIFPTILAVSLYFNGLKKVRAQSASILGLIEPVSAVILAVIILKESISVLELIGGALILIGAALVTREK
ncbi:MAG: EamA family transporter, partial [Candidatus Methanoperedens sp.]|nr:EamA family transporter [Candidatus Methanoperedens sp.]